MKEAATKNPVDLLKESEQAKKDGVLDAFVQKYLVAAEQAAAKAAAEAARREELEKAMEEINNELGSLGIEPGLPISDLLDKLNQSTKLKTILQDKVNKELDKVKDKPGSSIILEHKLIKLLLEELEKPEDNNLGILIYLGYECLYDINYNNNPVAIAIIGLLRNVVGMIYFKNRSYLKNYDIKNKNGDNINIGLSLKSLLKDQIIFEGFSDEMKNAVKDFVDSKREEDPEIFIKIVKGQSYDFFEAWINGKRIDHTVKDFLEDDLSEIVPMTTDSEGEGKVFKISTYDSNNNFLKSHRVNRLGQMLGGSKDLLDVNEYVNRSQLDDNNIYGTNKFFGWNVNKKGQRIDDNGNIKYLK